MLEGFTGLHGAKVGKLSGCGSKDHTTAATRKTNKGENLSVQKADAKLAIGASALIFMYISGMKDPVTRKSITFSQAKMALGVLSVFGPIAMYKGMYIKITK